MKFTHSQILASIDMGIRTPWETDIATIRIMRDILDHNDRWTNTLEGIWEEFQTGGSLAMPDYEFDDESNIIYCMEAMGEFIDDLDDELLELNIQFITDSDNGMIYFLGGSNE